MKAFFASALLGGVVVSVALWYLWSMQVEKAEQAIIDRESGQVVEDVRRAVKQHLHPTDFQTEDLQGSTSRYSALWRALQSPATVRIKVWGTNGTVLWADIKEIIGQRFPLSEEFKEALEGKVEVEVKETKELENLAESQYDRLAEIYVPITDGVNSQVIGVIEIYRSLSTVESEAQGMIWRQMAYPGMALLSAYGVFLVVARRVFVRRTTTVI